MNVRAALSEGTGALEKSRPGSPFLDAALLLGHALGIGKDRLLASMPEEVGDEPLSVYRSYIARRLRGEPVAYIVGHKEFYGREFGVDHRVLVPRPDTELLVEAALERLPRFDAAHGGKIRVHDAFTGSGCVGISIAAERPDVEVSLSDRSQAALQVASDNSITILGRKLEAVPADILSGVKGLFHLISANPPYVSTDTADCIMGDGGHEPRAALDGGEHGLDLFPALVAQAWDVLLEGGSLIAEIGEEQAEDVSKIFIAGGFGCVAVLRDLAGHDRVVAGVKHAAAV